jgi:hypothetical protein
MSAWRHGPGLRHDAVNGGNGVHHRRFTLIFASLNVEDGYRSETYQECHIALLPGYPQS